jgi:hypothetical protein
MFLTLILTLGEHRNPETEFLQKYFVATPTFAKKPGLFARSESSAI